MSTHRAGLAAILADGGPDFAFTLSEEASPHLHLADVIGVLQRERLLYFVWHSGSSVRRVAIEPVFDGPRSRQHEVYRLLELHPNGLWMARFSSENQQGTLVPFTPPRGATLRDAIPVFVSPDKKDLVVGFGAEGITDALAALRLRAGMQDILVAGQVGLAAMNEQEAFRLTLWSTSGDAIETVLEKQENGVRLVLLDWVPAADARRAHCGPNLIVQLEPGAELRLTDQDGLFCATAIGESLFPKRSPLLEAWMRYARLEHQLAEARLAARMTHPIVFSAARQHRKLWHVTIELSPDERKAWMGADPESHHEVQVDQQVALEGVDPGHDQDEDDRGHLVIWRMRAEGSGVVTATLKAQRGFRRLPENGRLRAVKNIGSAVEQKRQREAIELLQAGRAACPSLMDVLSAPGTAEKAQPVKTRLNQLDASQQSALQKILGCTDLVAIQGPPGTGKTSVIVEALLNLAERRKKGVALKVLVSSVQNEAIDNVAERLAREGILVHQIRRQSQDEEEAQHRAELQDQTRKDLLHKLERSLDGKPVIQAVKDLRERLTEIDRLRAILADDEAAFQLADEIARFCAESPLPTAIQEDGARVCALLRKVQTEPQPETESAPEQENEGPPGSAQKTAAWWDARKALWPLATRAAVEAAVRRVTTLMQQIEKNPLKDQTRLQTAFRDLLRLLEKAEQPAIAPVRARVPSAQHVAEQWLDQVQKELQVLGEKLLRYPEVIAKRFLDRLREDPAAWRQVQQRHSQTTTATCSMSAQARDLTEEPYDWVIIDEAGRATPLELLVPMVQGRRIVLIGDQRQLPPLLEDEVIHALEREQTPLVDLKQETLFGEIFKNLPRECWERLSVQYRMHEDIGRLVSQLFYVDHGEPLRSHFAGGLARERLPSFGVLGNMPVTLIDTEDRPGASPYENPEERKVVLALLTAFSDSATVRGLAAPLRIGVICAYARQRDRLEEDFRRLHASKREHWDDARLDVEIKTIDAVQGREYPVTIVCLVRRDGRPGFLAAPNRINVALSRAQRQLIILGTKESLTSDLMRQGARHMPQLIDMCSQSNWIRPWSQVRL